MDNINVLQELRLYYFIKTDLLEQCGTGVDIILDNFNGPQGQTIKYPIICFHNKNLKKLEKPSTRSFSSALEESTRRQPVQLYGWFQAKDHLRQSFTGGRSIEDAPAAVAGGDVSALVPGHLPDKRKAI